jgi:hypothetical protein
MGAQENKQTAQAAYAAFDTLGDPTLANRVFAA